MEIIHLFHRASPDAMTPSKCNQHRIPHKANYLHVTSFRGQHRLAASANDKRADSLAVPLDHTAPQRQTAVTAHLKSEQLVLFAFARQQSHSPSPYLLICSVCIFAQR